VEGKRIEKKICGMYKMLDALRRKAKAGGGGQ
jgi:hypothetical protein